MVLSLPPEAPEDDPCGAVPRWVTLPFRTGLELAKPFNDGAGDCDGEGELRLGKVKERDGSAFCARGDDDVGDVTWE